jgi:hypothetical protein
MSTCNDIITAYPLRNFLPSSLGNYLHLNGSVGIGGLVLGVCYLLNAGITFYWVRKQSIFALEGMIGSAKVYFITNSNIWCDNSHLLH